MKDKANSEPRTVPPHTDFTQSKKRKAAVDDNDDSDSIIVATAEHTRTKPSPFASPSGQSTRSAPTGGGMGITVPTSTLKASRPAPKTPRSTFTAPSANMSVSVKPMKCIC